MQARERRAHSLLPTSMHAANPCPRPSRPLAHLPQNEDAWNTTTTTRTHEFSFPDRILPGPGLPLLPPPPLPRLSPSLSGVEQAAGSVPLHHFAFPRLCVLLLGNEQSGVPQVMGCRARRPRGVSASSFICSFTCNASHTMVYVVRMRWHAMLSLLGALLCLGLATGWHGMAYLRRCCAVFLVLMGSTKTLESHDVLPPSSGAVYHTSGWPPHDRCLSITSSLPC